MAQRTNEVAVRAIIDDDSAVDVAAFIDTAVAVTDYVASQDSAGILTTALLFQIETYLAAHFYEHLDPQYTSKVTGDAEGRFQGEFGVGLDSSKWGQTAKRMDVTGTLASMDRGKRAVTVSWLGKPPSEQIDYVDRD